jgi:response regulator RpfG family c-di-GMP phosphodiesterase
MYQPKPNAQSVQSQALDVERPVEAGRRYAPRPDIKSGHKTSTSKPSACRIMVCDDSGAELAYITHLLERAGYTDVVAVNDPRRVMPLLQEHGFDLLLLDIEMPHITGVELTGMIRQRWSEAELPILMVTGTQGRDTRNGALAAGANDYLNKPVDPVEMALRVKNLLAVHAAYKQSKSVNCELERQVAARTAKLNLLIDNGVMIAAERDRSKLLRHILFEAQRLLNCDAGTLYLVTDRKTLRFAMRTKDDTLPSMEIPMAKPEHAGAGLGYVSTYVARSNTSVLIDDVYREIRFDLSGTRRFDAESHYKTVSMLTVPMAPRDGDVIGVLQFINAMDPATGAIIPFAPDLVVLVEAFAAQAAVALDNIDLVESQKGLMESMIRVMATAIDAKSPYTGKHCERVPELAMSLAQAACASTEGSLADFSFKNEDEWQEFRIGAWLHDVGKVTTPEYVIDKATKLETIYSRIHEVRTRFEVLLRDSDIERLNEIVAGQDPLQAMVRHDARVAELQDDFAFVAQCNLGGETMERDHVDRLQRVATRTWLRHFDDRLGLSQDEVRRAAQEPVQPLPALENLLADKLRHIVPRSAAQVPEEGFGFKMKVPEHLYNYGELYNLTVTRGTLTEEERFKINEHMIHTIVMLERMAFPKWLKRVPEYAGTHHETLTGTGYPRRLGEAELSVPSRIMAIADIFEALTAADRPYKTAKKLSEALRILHYMKKSRHIDPELFDLFLSSGVYLDYARKHLSPEQIDEVDIASMIGPVAVATPVGEAR